MMAWFFFDTRMVVVAIEAAERKVCVDFIFRLHLVGIVACGGNDLVDLELGEFRRIIDYGEFLGLGVPRSCLDAFRVERCFDALLAHAAVAVDFDLRFFGLSERERAYKNEERECDY